jgi:drug/metabolite transporter (DMT)-like permease
MLQSRPVLALISAGLLGNLVVLVRWRRFRTSGSLLARNLAIGSLAACLAAVGFAFDVFTQVWVARPGSISGAALVLCGVLFLALSIAAVAAMLVSRHKHSHAAA